MGGAISDLRIGEKPWNDIPPLPRDCICDDVSGSLTLAPVAASTVEAHFTTLKMDIDQDFRDFYFEGRYEFVKNNCQINWDERRLHGVSGEAYLGPASCAITSMIQPWLIEPESDDNYLVLMMKGFWMPTLLHSATPCPTDARITVYSTNNPKASRDLCPAGSDVVAFSDGWDSIGKFNPIEISKNLVIEYRAPWRPNSEPSDYRISWMEISPDNGCQHKCAELRGCISPKLWCDGKIHCPSGQDEEPSECQEQPPLSPLHVGAAAAALTIMLSLAAGLAACARRKRCEKKTFQNQRNDVGNINVTNDSDNMGSNSSIGNSNYTNHHHRHHRHMHPHTHHNHQTSSPPLYLDSQPKDNYC